MYITFVKAKVTDAEENIEVRADAFYDEVMLYGHGPSLFDSVEAEKELLRNPQEKNHCYLVKKGKEIIAGMAIEELEEDEFHLDYIYVKREFQNLGIGSVMLRFLEEKFKRAKKWSLETPYLSIRNHHFYERNGFVKVGETKPNADGFFLFQYEKVIC